jgi:hypothetical protein
MAIAAAINHIEMVTQERDMLQNENDEIREYRRRLANIETRSAKSERSRVARSVGGD